MPILLIGRLTQYVSLFQNLKLSIHFFIQRSDPSREKINFELEPINNERFGVFVDLNGIEIGYATDFINDTTQTETEDFLFSYKGFKHSKITFNYQTLEGFETNALNLLNESQQESRFSSGTKSTKFELLGIHDLHTFYGESLFDHFFLNRPKLSQSIGFGLSLTGGWSYKNLLLESEDNLLFKPDYLNSIGTVDRIRAESFDVSIGPLLSVNLKNNIHMFAEAKFGKGYFRNLEENEQLKRSGNEDIYSLGAGISWTMASKKTVFLLRGWQKKGRHVETFFGDLSAIHYF
ncbi:hypothetical protein [Pseudocolwellia sp. HL-MZ7]|uniref:hypothetical protein n=1 Tax=Pseudocolwellia sp. HL-MZ7 TaxID=3400627 RepID=UPI003CFB5EE6